MRYLFLSDLHLGNPLFECTNEIISLLQKQDFDELILLGDIIDSWQGEIVDIFTDNERLIGEINSAAMYKPTTYVIGNHDPDIEDIKRLFPSVDICEKYTIDKGIILHGHEFDDLILKYSFFAKVWHYLSCFTERVFRFSLKTWITELFYSIAEKRDKKYYGDLVTEVGERIVEKYRKEYEFAVAGHTHYPVIENLSEWNFIYVNCGDLIHNFTYVTYDSETKNFELHKIK